MDIFERKSLKVVSTDGDKFRMTYWADNCTDNVECLVSPSGELRIGIALLRYRYSPANTSKEEKEKWIKSCFHPDYGHDSDFAPVKPDPKRKPTLEDCRRSLNGIIGRQINKLDSAAKRVPNYIYVKSKLFASEKSGISQIDFSKSARQELDEKGLSCLC